jgi:N-acetylglucosaminyldiphosphoundecaprenol N-acetyl-beta-D-mannosaminyltransferase
MSERREIAKRRVISLDIDLLSYRESVNQVLLLAEQRKPSYACFANAHMVVEAFRDPSFQEKVNRATFVFADGMPLIFAVRLLYGVRQERVAGMDITADVLKGCEERGLSIFLYGSTTRTLAAFADRIRTGYPTLKLAGMISPPFRPLLKEEMIRITTEINQSGAQIVLVGLGCPKQEKWMADHSHLIKACLLGVGGAFGVYAGDIKRAPKWMQRIGLEWLFRLGLEPRRLAKRYLATNSLFLVLFFKQMVLSLFRK